MTCVKLALQFVCGIERGGVWVYGCMGVNYDVCEISVAFRAV